MATAPMQPAVAEKATALQKMDTLALTSMSVS